MNWPVTCKTAGAPFEMGLEADAAIARLFATHEHDAATESLRQVLQVKDATDGDPLAVLEALTGWSAISKWDALHDQTARPGVA